MKPDRYEPWAGERRRLSGLIRQRGPSFGSRSGVGLVFGCPFVAVGVFVVLIGAKVVAVNPAGLHAPQWVLTCAGVIFVLAGLALWGAAWQQLSMKRQRQRLGREHPGEAALADYPWNRNGFEVSHWTAAAKALAMAAGLTLFVSIFNYWAFFTGAPLMVKIIVGGFDCICLLLWGLAARQVGRALKFGRSGVFFTRFPYRLEEPVAIRWQAPRGVSRVNRGKFTLRCVEEWLESTGTRDRSCTVVHEEIWSGTWVFEQPRNFQLRESVELSYELPPEARPTQLNTIRPVFWEFQAELSLPGLDFDETYLVPIYSSRTAPALAEPLRV